MGDKHNAWDPTTPIPEKALSDDMETAQPDIPQGEDEVPVLEIEEVAPVSKPEMTKEEITHKAMEVIAGKHGKSHTDACIKLADEGFDGDAILKKIDDILHGRW